MTQKFIAYFVFALFGLLAGCGSSKKVETVPPVPKPQWVSSRPTSQTHYIGIGSTTKTVDVNQYQTVAKQNAQADLASEISVNVSANSVLHVLEKNLNFREDFTKTIRTEVQEDIEGFELIDTWEDETSYWVYYRLSKAEHQRIKEKKKKDAVARSLDSYGKGLDALNSRDVRLALVNFIKALEPIKPYFSEPIPADFRGKSIELGNEIYVELSATLSAIEIKPVNASISVKTGGSLNSNQLQFKVFHKKHEAVFEIPTVANYSEKPIRDNSKRTQQDGFVNFMVEKVQSTKPQETFNVSIDLDALVVEATADQFVRKLVNRFPKPEASVLIVIEKPTLFIVSWESELGSKQNLSILKNAFIKKAVEGGFLIETDKKNADYEVTISAATSAQGQNGAYKIVSLEGNIKVDTPKGNQIYYKPFDGITGTHFEYKAASQKAFDEAKRKIEVSYFREISDAIKRN